MRKREKTVIKGIAAVIKTRGGVIRIGPGSYAATRDRDGSVTQKNTNGSLNPFVFSVLSVVVILNVEILYIQGIILDKFAARFDLVAH